MSDVLSTSVSGLLAFQRALDVTSNNISNASTPGYSVENTNFTPQPALPTASGYIGSGVAVQSITRSYDELLAGQVRSSQSSYSNFNTFATQAAQIDNMLSDSSTGLTASLQAFVNSLQTVANSPSSTAQRQALLSQAQALAQQMQNTIRSCPVTARISRRRSHRPSRRSTPCPPALPSSMGRLPRAWPGQVRPPMT